MIVTTLPVSGVQKLQVTGNISIDMEGVVFIDDAVDFVDNAVSFLPKNCDSYGFVYGESSVMSNPGDVAPASSGYDSYTTVTGDVADGSFTNSVTDLTAGITYYARAWAHNPEGYVYGDEITFQTILNILENFVLEVEDADFILELENSDFTVKFSGGKIMKLKPSSFKKQPDEIRTITVDCSNALPVGVTISSVDVDVFDDDDTDVTTDIIDSSSIDSSDVLITIKGGTDGENYNLKMLLTLSNGNKPEGDLKIKVREVWS